MHSLVQHPDFQGLDVSCIKLILVGATTVLPADIKLCQERLGAEVVVDGYSMTEANAAYICRYTAAKGTTGKGAPCQGLHIRICEPGTRRVVKRGVQGEVNLGGDVVIAGYLLAPDQQTGGDPFYEDSGTRWIMTDDKGIMDENNIVRTVGRYKDMIIRGGENIAPAAIESALSDTFGLTAQVVGIPDDLVGEVPAAVIKTNDHDAEQVDFIEIRETLKRDLGPAFMVEEMINISDLGRSEFPTTSTGKVQKNVLKDLLVEHLQRENSDENGLNGTDGMGPGSNQENGIEALSKIWSKLLGVKQESLDPDTPLSDWADSLTLSRSPRILKREADLSISTQELVSNLNIIRAQPVLFGRNTQHASVKTPIFASKRDCPPGIVDVPCANGSQEFLKKAEVACNKVMASLGLTWEDVEDVIPLYSFLERFLHCRRLQSNNHRHAFMSTASSTLDLRQAIEAALTNNAMFRTMAIHLDGKAYHIVVRPSAKFFDACITTVEDPETSNNLNMLAFNDMEIDYAADPGSLFKVLLTHVKDENRAGMVYMVQHSIFDGISLPLFLQDIDASLCEQTSDSPPQRFPYKAWADSYDALSTSKSILHSVDWHVERLANAQIHKRPEALFPFQRASEWFKGDASGWKDGVTRQSLDAEPSGVRGLNKQCFLPGASNLRKTHGVETPQVLKAALAILNHKQTRSPVALFAQYQAARTWPGLLDWQIAQLPSAMDVCGPTVQVVVNAIEINPAQTVADMLKDLQAQQSQLNKHAIAPFDQIIERLNAHESGPGAGDFMREVWRRQILNWLPPDEGVQLKCLNKVQQISRIDVGLLWNVLAVGHEEIQVMPSWDDAQLRKAEVEDLTEDLIRLARWLVLERNCAETISNTL